MSSTLEAIARQRELLLGWIAEHAAGIEPSAESLAEWDRLEVQIRCGTSAAVAALKSHQGERQ